MEGIARDSSGVPLASSDLSLVINVPRAGRRRSERDCPRRLSTWSESATSGSASRRAAGSLQGSARSSSVSAWPPASPGCRSDSPLRPDRPPSRCRPFDAGIEAHSIPRSGWMRMKRARSSTERTIPASSCDRRATAARERDCPLNWTNDKRFKLRALPEVEYYLGADRRGETDQDPRQLPGDARCPSARSSAAMNTMYAAVGARTREIGTLRVLGYEGRASSLAFFIEGALLALIGGVLGCIFSLSSTAGVSERLSFETFSEIVFDFRDYADADCARNGFLRRGRPGWQLACQPSGRPDCRSSLR